jgi:hypothetical protein
MGIFMVYTIQQNPIQIFNCIKYLVWLIIEINVWNGIYALAQLIVFVTFHYKMVIC